MTRENSAGSARPVLPRIGAWCFAVVGGAHLALMALKLATGQSEAERSALAHLRSVTVPGFGIERNLLQLYYGFSATMGLIGLGYGMALLTVANRSPALLARRAPLVWLSFALAAIGFAIAVAAFPSPPVVALGLATVAFGLELGAAPARR